MHGRIWEMTAAQEQADTALGRAITKAVADGEVVPCQRPDLWRDDDNPQNCAGCPLVAQECLRFANTGAITDGAIAGMKLAGGRIVRVASFLLDDAMAA